MKPLDSLRMSCALIGGLAAGIAEAHSASDAYLTLDLQSPSPIVRGQWDIALRDLDFVLKLDDDGNGQITWEELRHHQEGIGKYALAHLKVLGDGTICPLTITKQRVANHADGAYAVVFFEARCAVSMQRLTLDYGLFFDIDPSHRAIVVAHTGGDTATALMSPQNARIDLKLIGHAPR
jgi:hypothetical protein